MTDTHLATRRVIATLRPGTKNRRVRIRTRTVGLYFGTDGQVVTLTGRLLAAGPTRPYGFAAAALGDAKAIVERNGWIVVD